MEEPGGLNDLGPAGRAAWQGTVEQCLSSAVNAAERQPFLLDAPDPRTPEITGPDWTGLPTRVVSCLGRRHALSVLDHERQLQEEYLEWRVVRGEDGRVRRVELTSELPELWSVLAAYEPDRAIHLTGELVGRPVRAHEVYGGRPSSSPAARQAAFSAAMLARSNPLNDGREGILFMQQRDNNLRALVEIAAEATLPCVLSDQHTGRSRCATAYEAIPLIDRAAVAGRASDPVIVERLGRLAYERRLVALDDPVGIYIQGVEHTRLRTPDGEPVPSGWFRMDRGVRADESRDGCARHQRVVLEVPREHGFAVGDLVDCATEQPVRYGGQVAELIQLRLLVRVSPGGRVGADAALEFDPDRPRPDPCEDILDLLGHDGPLE